MAWDDAPPTPQELQQPSQSWDSAPPTPQELNQPNQNGGFLNQVKGALDVYNQNPAFSTSPQGLLQKGYGLVQKLADKAGSYVTDAATQALRQPNASIFPESWRAPMAAGAGTAVAMTPDIIMSAANPEEGAVQTPQNEYAQMKGLQAMGAPKRIFKTPESTANAMGHSQTLLDQGLIKPFRGAQGLADNLSNLEQSSGQKIGDILSQFKEQGKFFDPQEGIQAINKLRPVTANGQVLEGGAYDTINSKIDNAIKTIQAHLPQMPQGGGLMVQPMNFDEANQLKTTLQGLANYASNKDATLLDKAVAGKFREALDNSLNQAANEIGDPNLSQQFQEAKKIYSSTQFAKDPVYNRLSSELANKGISLTDWILGAHSLASGNPLTAVGEVAAKKLFEKYGNSTQAAVSNALSKTPKLLSAPNKAFGAQKAMSLFTNKDQNDPIPQQPSTPQPAKPKQVSEAPTDQTQLFAMARRPPEPPPQERPAVAAVRAEAPKKPLDAETARIYLNRAKGDKAQAREMAINDGWRLA